MLKRAFLWPMSAFAVLMGATPVEAQLPPPQAILPPQTALLGHQTAAPGTAYVDELAMGRDNNPARLFDVPSPSASIKFGRAPNDNLPDLTVGYVQFTPRLEGRWRSQFSFVRSSGDGTVGPGAFMNYREQDFSAQFAYQADSQTAVGIAVSYLSTKTDLSVANLGSFELSSRPDRLLAGRLGLSRKLNEKLDLELVYDNYAEKSKLRAPAIFGDLALSTTILESRKYSIGGVYHHRRGDLALFYSTVKVNDGAGYDVDEGYFHGGIDVPLGNFSVQAGLYDRFGSLGLGYSRGKTKINAAVTNRYKVLNPQAQSAVFIELQREF